MFFSPHCCIFGRSGLRPSLVQGLRPRNAPLQKHASPTVCLLRNVSAGEHGGGLYTSCVTKNLNGSKDDWLVKYCGLVVTTERLRG